MKKILTLAPLMLLACLANAHTVNYQLDKLSGDQVFWKYLVTGYEHIIPAGLDHILFITCVFFLNTDLKKVIAQATMFTLAHSITLGLAMYGIIKPPTSIVEPLIALSIVLLAMENIKSDKLNAWRIVVVFLFGLVHGMGFAGALSELGMPTYAFGTALLSFNVGVELGQLSIILGLYLLVSKTFSMRPWYRTRIVIPTSTVIAIVAAYWTIERIFFTA
jgi:hypothetical protein